MRVLLILAFTILSSCVSIMDSDLLVQSTSGSKEFIIKGSLVFDGFKFVKEQDVWVKNGSIHALGENLKTGSNVAVINGVGKTLMPGLIDMHTHLFSAGAPPWRTTMGDAERTLSANLAVGVTSVLDMAAPLGDISSWNNETGIQLPRFAYAGTIFNVEGGHPSYMIEASIFWPLSKVFKSLLISEISSLKDAKQHVDEHKKAGVSFIKIVFDEIPLGSPMIDDELLSGIVRYAKEQGLKTVAHIGTEQDILSGVKAKLDLFVHGVYRSNFSEKALKRLKDSGIPVVPTAVVWDQLVKFYDNSAVFNEMELFVLDSEIAKAYADRPAELKLDEAVLAWFEAVKHHEKTKFDVINAMYQNGIPLFVGSDSPNIGNVSGASVHKELSLWQANTDIPVADILAAATGNSGEWLENYLGWKVGQIKPGYDADLLLVNGDLSKDVSLSKNISAVWISGQAVSTSWY